MTDHRGNMLSDFLDVIGRRVAGGKESVIKIDNDALYISLTSCRSTEPIFKGINGVPMSSLRGSFVKVSSVAVRCRKPVVSGSLLLVNFLLISEFFESNL